MDGVFASQKNENAAEALWGQRALLCREQVQKQPKWQPDLQRKPVKPGPAWAPLCSSCGFRHRLALTWFGFQVLAFEAVFVSMTTQSYLGHACYLAPTSRLTHGTPPYGFNLPSFSLTHPTPSFQLQATLPDFHPAHVHLQTPASGWEYRLPPPGQFQHRSAARIFYLR